MTEVEITSGNPSIQRRDSIQAGFQQNRQTPVTAVEFKLYEDNRPGQAAGLSLQGASGGDTLTGSAAEMYRQYMKELRGEEVSKAKTPEEKIEELKKKVEKLQAEMSETATNEKLPEEVKSSRMEALRSQIAQLESQISELEELVAAQQAVMGMA